MPKVIAKKQKAQKSSSNKPTNSTTYTIARETVTDGIKKHGKAPKTTQNYDSYIRRGVEFLEQFALDESKAEGQWTGGQNSTKNLSTDEEDQIPGGEEGKMPTQFQHAFTGPPIECTPLAISMFLADKCLTQNLGKSTASGIHAAFLLHYDQMNGDKYRGRWHYDHAGKEWVGNPVRSAEVEDIHEACKNKDGEGERRHSRAMSIEDMQALLNYSQKHCPSVDPSLPNSSQIKMISERGAYLFFKAFSSSAFTVWMRIGEVSTLQYKNLEFPNGRRPTSQKSEQSEQGVVHFFKLNLRNRKNWQKREKNGEHQLNGHMYKIYPQPRTPEIDMYNHLLEWLDFYERFLLGRPLNKDDYLFPTIGSTGTSVQPDRPISPDIAQKKIAQMAEKAGVLGAKYFTTHCFRRGGAQYRFMFAPLGERWILARIRWWGGWANGEHRDTLIRYLLDELYTYEEDHSDALCPNPRPKMLDSTPGPPPDMRDIKEFTRQVSVMNSELEQYHTLLKQAVNVSATGIPQSSGSQFPFSQRQAQSMNFSESSRSSPWPEPLMDASVMTGAQDHQLRQSHSLPPLQSTTPTFCQTQEQDHTVPRTPELVHIIPGLPHGRSSKAYEQVVRDWEYADPSRSLYVPMKDWKPEWRRARNQTQKFGQRKIVALEFIDHFNRDVAGFTAAYPEHTKGFTPLLNAIRHAQQQRGECEERFSRRKHQRASN